MDGVSQVMVTQAGALQNHPVRLYCNVWLATRNQGEVYLQCTSANQSSRVLHCSGTCVLSLATSSWSSSFNPSQWHATTYLFVCPPLLSVGEVATCLAVGLGVLSPYIYPQYLSGYSVVVIYSRSPAVAMVAGSCYCCRGSGLYE